MSHIRQFFAGLFEGVSAGMSHQSRAPGGDDERPRVRWYAIRRDQITGFFRECPGAMFADNFLAALLENGKEDYLPDAARQLAEMQSQNPDCLIFALLRS